jgi:DNA-binding NarL/FixJ family response regulator
MTAVPSIRIVIARREPLIRAGLECALAPNADFEVSAVAEERLLGGADLRSIDVLLADCELGVQLATTARQSGCRILIVTHDEREGSIARALEAGVRGYVLLSSSLEAVAHAVRCVVRGGTSIDPLAATKMIERLNGDRLTRRELDVLSLLTLGLADKAISNRLGIAVGTVKSHVKRLREKLNVTSRTQIAAVAQRRGLLPPESPERRAIIDSYEYSGPRRGTIMRRMPDAAA